MCTPKSLTVQYIESFDVKKLSGKKKNERLVDEEWVNKELIVSNHI